MFPPYVLNGIKEVKKTKAKQNLTVLNSNECRDLENISGSASQMLIPLIEYAGKKKWLAAEMLWHNNNYFAPVILFLISLFTV